jgi:hypothetical protein
MSKFYQLREGLKINIDHIASVDTSVRPTEIEMASGVKHKTLEPVDDLLELLEPKPVEEKKKK